MIGHSRVALSGLMALWAVGTVAAFWHFEGQYLRPVTRPVGAAVAKTDVPPPVGSVVTTDRGTVTLDVPGPVTLLNFWNPACPCSRYAEAHVRRLGMSFGPQGVRLLTIVECGRSSAAQSAALSAWRTRNLPDYATVPDPGGRIARAFGVWAAPAAVVIDARGHVVYVGAYNAARYCDDSHTAWAQQALEAVLAGRKPPRAKTLFFGCQVVGQGS